MGWFGIAYFSSILLLLWLRHKVYLLDLAVSVMVFSGIGAELRLLWIQKYIIGSWCPLCVTICCALFLAAILLLIENVQDTGSGEDRWKGLLGWLAFVTAMMGIGLAVAVAGVKALS
jgi:disulfide bond formation protein DsbB